MTSRPLDEPLHFSSHEYDEFCAFCKVPVVLIWATINNIWLPLVCAALW